MNSSQKIELSNIIADIELCADTYDRVVKAFAKNKSTSTSLFQAKIKLKDAKQALYYFVESL